MPTEPEKLYDTVSGAALLNITSDHLRLLARQGKIACSKRGRKFVFSQSQLDAYRRGEPYVPTSKH